MEKTLASLSTKSETAGAIRYALSRWRALTRYVDDGLLEIDNNAAERSLRSVVMGRRRIICFLDLIPAANELHRSTASLRQPNSNGARPGVLPSYRSGPNPRTSYQPHRRTPALEYRRFTQHRLITSRLTTLNKCPLKLSGHFELRDSISVKRGTSHAYDGA